MDISAGFNTDRRFYQRRNTKTKLGQPSRVLKDEYQSDESVNASLLWEMVKLKVREQTLRYAKTKKAKVLREEELDTLHASTKSNFVACSLIALTAFVWVLGRPPFLSFS